MRTIEIALISDRLRGRRKPSPWSTPSMEQAERGCVQADPAPRALGHGFNRPLA